MGLAAFHEQPVIFLVEMSLVQFDFLVAAPNAHESKTRFLVIVLKAGLLDRRAEVLLASRAV